MATETVNVNATVDGGATDIKQDEQTAKLEQVRVLLAAGGGGDATAALQQTTLDALATLARDSSLTQIIALLDALATASETQPVSIAGTVSTQAQRAAENTVATATFTTTGDSTFGAVRPGDNQVVVEAGGSWTGQIIVICSRDGGVTYADNLYGTPYYRNTSAPGKATGALISIGVLVAALPPGVTHVKATAFPLSTGTGTIKITSSANPLVPDQGLARDASLAGLALDTTLAAQSAKIPAQSNGRLPVESLAAIAPAATTGTISGAGQFIPSAGGLAVPTGAATVAMFTSGAGTNWLGIQYSPDGGTTWLTLPGSRVDSLSPAANIIATHPGTIWATLPADATFVRIYTAAALAGSNNGALRFGFNQTTPFTLVGGQVSLAGGTNTIGTVNQATPTPISVTSTASTNASSQKASAGTLYGLVATNPTGTAAYVKLYNKASAPTVGTDVPVITIPVAAGATVSLSLGALGHRFATGIAMAVTGLGTDADATAAVAGVKIVGDYV